MPNYFEIHIYIQKLWPEQAQFFIVLSFDLQVRPLPSSVTLTFNQLEGWLGGAMVLGKLPVPGRPTNFDKSRAKAYFACSSARGDCLDNFSFVYTLFFFPLSGRRPNID